MALKNRLFIGNLAAGVSEQELEDLFSQVGEVAAVEIIRDWESRQSRGFGFVQMAKEQEAALAIDRLHGSELHQKKIRVLVAKSRRELMAEPEPQAAAAKTQDQPEVDQASEAQVGEDEHDQAPSEDLAEGAAAPDERARSETSAEPAAPAPTAGHGSARGTRSLFLLAVGALVAVGAVVLWLAVRERAPAPDPGTLLVVPMEVYGQTEGAEYLGYAFAQAVAVNLAPAEGIKVLPVPQASEVRGTSAQKATRSALEVGAGRLLIGSLRRSDDSVHASLTLVDPVENRILWGIQKKGRDSEILGLASEIARAVITHLGSNLPKRYPYIADVSGGPAMATSPVAARSIAAIRQGDVRQALTSTAELVEAFPDEPVALALHTHARVMSWDSEPSADNLRALKTSLEGLERTGQGYPYADFYRAYLTDAELQKPGPAISMYSAILNHGDLEPAARAWVLRYRGMAHQQNGDLAGALADLNESLSLAPTNAWTLGILSSTLVDAGKLDEAYQRAHQGLALAPSYWRSHHGLGLVLAAMGRRAEAAEAYGRACDLGKNQLSCSLYALALKKLGREDAARVAIDRAAAMAESPWGLYNRACYWALSNDRDRAMQLLPRAVAGGHLDRTMITDPDLASLKGDPAFDALVNEIKKRALQHH